MNIVLHDGFHLTPVREGDQPAYIEHLNDRGISDWMLLIPFPYTPQDADFWVRHCLDSAQANANISEFALRREDGYLIGGAGIRLKTGLGSHRGELGYWMSRKYWGRGLATAIVRALTTYAFATLGLKRMEATTFIANKPSQRVLEKAGYQREGLLAGYHYKDEILIDAYMYALVKRDERG